MDNSSEYSFPIFISSTDYNLKDLRAELARFLKELGYRPILSSSEGFPDSSPNMEPWESCIPVLEHSFVMVLVIDGRYGSSLDWVNSAPCLQGKNVAPTHGEYIYAHHTRKRMLVFIREEVMTYYQSYRTTLKNCGKDSKKAKEVLNKILPDYIDFETLEFVHDVKTTKPIPWIKEFKDITDIKKEVQKKMLNELAEIFLIKTARLETVVDAFDKAMYTLSWDKQKDVLSSLRATKELVKTGDQIAEYQKELNEKTEALNQIEGENEQQRGEYEKEITGLKSKIKKLEQKSQRSSDNNYYIKDGSIQVNPHYVPSVNNYHALTGTTIGGGLYGISTDIKCDSCLMIPSLLTGILNQKLRKCPKCKRVLCGSCWSQFDLLRPKANVFSNLITADAIEEKVKEDICSMCSISN